MNRRHFLGLAGGAIASAGFAGDASRKMKASFAAGNETLDAAAFHATRRFVKTPFGDVAYVERGVGDAALFLHGFPLNGFQWRGALERLSPYRRCIAPDFMAMGYTHVADGQDVGPDAQVAMLVEFLDTLGIANVDLVANDSGGAVAQLLVVRHPQRVRSLLLTNCDVETDSPPAAILPVIKLSKEGKFVDEWLGKWRSDKSMARSPQGIGGLCYADPTNPTDEAIDTYFAPLLSTPRQKALVHAYAIALERNPLEGIAVQLVQSVVPVRIVWGMGDTIFSAASPDYLDQTLGNSRGVRKLESSKLFWPEERPDVIAEEARLLWSL